MRTKDARIPLTDRGFLYGDGVFETVRIHRGAPFRLDAHLARLWRGLKTLRLEAPPRLGDVRKGMRALVSASLIKEGLVRITTTAPEGDGEGRVVVTSRDLPTPPREVVLHVATGVRRTPGPLTSCKTLSRIVESVALREAQVHGAFDGVILNDVGRIVETSTRNLFLSAEGQLVTPPASEGALEGVTRAAVLELAGRLGVPAAEAPVPLDLLGRADEMFLTGSGVGVLGVAQTNSKAFRPVPGPHTTALTKGYRTLLDEESRW